MIQRIKAWLARGKVSDTLSRSVKKVDLAEKVAISTLAVLNNKIGEIERLRRENQRLQSRIEAILDEVEESVGISKTTISRQNETIDGLRSEIQVATDITIPALVAAHALVLERVEADTAIQVRTKVATSPAAEGGP